MGQSTSTPLQETDATHGITVTTAVAASTNPQPMDDADTKDIVMIEKPAARDSSLEADNIGVSTPPTGVRSARSESVPAGDAPITTQSELDAALASIGDPASVTNLTLVFSHKRPIADVTLLNEYGLISDDVSDPYDDHAKNAFSLNALSAFTSLTVLSVTTDDGCCHPLFLAVPRSAWARLSSLEGNWATFRIVD
ncbi:hypothetical protein pneo_cds_80 [Pandoravirus neocaledonia]|uniref:Uncharacterized protein n=1 Tax=Pandoravirus neocaledonia TaxID=2107708 RepID=A0A2U7UB62_9VIRU|nr:hypothetical protein pneo_cds_80 [Pandoravirus neocaledonia]AVK75687.1 hypothetical protein pneo_cds_80 [Pandoravirus neocaledonia]